MIFVFLVPSFKRLFSFIVIRTFFSWS